MEKQTVTIYDVAREAGVSMATVSRVVNGNPNVRPATRQKVTEVIERLNYRPNAVARGLASKKTTTVGVIIPNVSDVYYSSLARGIDDIATMYKYDIFLANSDDSTEKEIKVFNNLLAKQVDGLIYMGREVSPKLKSEILKNNTPVVVAGTDVTDPDLYAVNIDLTAAFEDATSHLLQRGRKVFLVTESGDYLISRNELAGYQHALEKYGHSYDNNYVLQQNFTHRDGDKIWGQIKHTDANAVLVASDYIAAAISNSIQDAGYSIPGDFEIITAQNSIITELSRPSLTSVRQPLYDIGAVATRLLTKIMNNEEVDEKQVTLPHQIKYRASSPE